MKKAGKKSSALLRDRLRQVQALAQRNYLGEAKLICTDICRENASNAEAWFLLGTIHGQLQEYELSVQCLERSVAIRPDMPAAYFNLGMALDKLGNCKAAINNFQQAIRLQPGNAEAYHELANTLRTMGDYEAAIANYRRSVSIRPDSWLTQFNMATTLFRAGECEEAEAHYQQALDAGPDIPSIHSSILHVMNYFERNPEATFIAHCAWWSRHFSHLPVATPTSPDLAGRRIRIGYVSPDFRRHSVAYFLEPLLTHHDRASFEIFCYSDVVSPDTVTDLLRGSVEQWRDIRPLHDAAVANLIRSDGIDILVDLAGHTDSNRLAVFAHRPAPIQVTYLGYPNTTGMPVMDYRITDAQADPPGLSDALYSETLLRLTDGFLCYKPPPDAPHVTFPNPGTSGRPLTFGSFNNLAKINPRVVAVWAELLTRLPDTQLLIKNGDLESELAKNRYRRRFSEHGIDLDRLVLTGRTASTAAHLNMYGEIDVALDTFPYNGTTTTCEALWMGVPVVTLCGDNHAGRVGASLLTRVGMQELIATSPTEYIELATSLALDAGKRRELRAGLRERMSASPLCDGVGFAANMENAYREMLQSAASHNRS